MRTFTLQVTLLASIPVKAKTEAEAKQKLREELASSELYVGMLDDKPIVVAAEIEGDLDFLDASEYDDFRRTPHFEPSLKSARSGNLMFPSRISLKANRGCQKCSDSRPGG